MRYVTQGGGAKSKRYVWLHRGKGGQKWPNSALRNFWTAPHLKIEKLMPACDFYFIFHRLQSQIKSILFNVKRNFFQVRQISKLYRKVILLKVEGKINLLPSKKD